MICRALNPLSVSGGLSRASEKDTVSESGVAVLSSVVPGEAVDVGDLDGVAGLFLPSVS